MYILIEHSGTEEHNNIVEEIKDHLEDTYGVTCESIVGKENGPITLYNEDQEVLVEFFERPHLDILDFYFLAMEEE